MAWAEYNRRAKTENKRKKGPRTNKQRRERVAVRGRTGESGKTKEIELTTDVAKVLDEWRHNAEDKEAWSRREQEQALSNLAGKAIKGIVRRGAHQ